MQRFETLCDINLVSSRSTHLGKELKITGSPAGLSRVNGVRRSSAETRNFSHFPKAQFYINWYDIWREWLRFGGYQPWQSWFGSDERSRRHVGATYTGTVTFFSFYYILLQPIPVNQFSRTIAQKTRSGVRKTLFAMRNVFYWNFGVFYPKNTPTIFRKGQLPAKIKSRITPKR